MDRVEARFASEPPPAPEEVTEAFWHACRRHRPAAEYLLARGAALEWVSGWDGLTPLDAAERKGAADLVEWLRGKGARSASEIGD